MVKRLKKQSRSRKKIMANITKGNYTLYLNNEERQRLNELKKIKGKTGANIIREFITCEIHSENLENIKKLNEINETLLINLYRIGNNINQIAYQLNSQQSGNHQEQFNQNAKELKQLLKEYKETIIEQKIPLKIAKINKERMKNV